MQLTALHSSGARRLFRGRERANGLEMLFKDGAAPNEAIREHLMWRDSTQAVHGIAKPQAQGRHGSELCCETKVMWETNEHRLQSEVGGNTIYRY